MEEIRSPCNLIDDLFFRLLIDYDDVVQAGNLIRLCKRKNVLLKSPERLKEFLNYYDQSILDLEYKKMMELFSRNQEIFSIYWNNPEFWRIKMMLEIEGKRVTPLEHYSIYGYTMYVAKYIEDNPDLSYDNYRESLFNASNLGYIDIVKFLLPHQEWKTSDLNKALEFSAISGYYLIVELLLELGADPSIENNKIIRAISRSERYIYDRHAITFQLLLRDPRVDPSVNNNEVIVNLITTSDFINNNLVKMIKSLLRNPLVDPSANDNEIMRNIMSRKEFSGYIFDLIKLLIKDPRVDPSVNNSRILFLVVPNDLDSLYMNVIRLLLEDKRIDPSANNNEVLRFIISRKVVDYNILSLLLKDARVDSSIVNTKLLQQIKFKKPVAKKDPYKIIHDIITFSYLYKDPIKTVRLFLRNNDIDLTKNNNEFIRLASKHKQYHLLKLFIEDERIDSQLEENEVLRMILIDLIQIEGKHISLDDSISIKKLIKIYRDLRREKPPVPDFLEGERILYDYWKSKINKRNDAFNISLLEENNRVIAKRWEITVNFEESLKDFLQKYKMEVRGILQKQEKEMRVIFQAYPHSAVSIVHIIEKD